MRDEYREQDWKLSQGGCTLGGTDLSAPHRSLWDSSGAETPLQPANDVSYQTFKTGEAWQPHAG
jgi:hypothetical protein